MMLKVKAVFFAVMLLVQTNLLAQNEPVIIQAESGALGSEWTTATLAGVQYVTIQTNVITGGNPGNNTGNSNRVITYTVTFPRAGTYELYTRVRVGPAADNDDSYFYGNGFGSKTASNDAHWIIANGLSGFGFTAAADVVTGAGNAGSNTWKWINMSKFDGGEPPITFTVPAGNLTQTFQIGGRENGLFIDKFAFGPAGVYYTVSNLDNGEAGSNTPPQPPLPPYTPVGPPLATGKPKFLGSVYSPSQIANFTAYFNQVTPENAGKWGSVEGTRDVMNWTELDAAYKLAKDNGFSFKLHALVWGNQQPAWIETLPPAEQLEEIKEWFSLLAARYPNMDQIEVVNEPLNDPPGTPGSGGGNYIGALGGTGATGFDWVLTSFRLARQYFPNSQLLINEFGIVGSANTTGRYINLVNLLKAENLIDGIGVQAHAFTTRPSSSATITSNLNLLAATGLPIYATELDIDGPSDQIQLDEYKRVIPLFWEHPGVKGITLWGYRPGLWRNAQAANIAYANGAERPALVWLKAYIRNNNPVANGWLDRFITPNSVLLNAWGSFDPDSHPVTYSWRKIAGPDTFTIASANYSTPVISNLVVGQYTFQLTVRDSLGATSTSNVTFRVGNKPPVANAWIDRYYSPTSVLLNAWGSSDPEGGPLRFSWSKVSGPASFTITSGQYSTPVISNLVTGTYVFRLTVTDDMGATATRDVTIPVGAMSDITDNGRYLLESQGSIDLSAGRFTIYPNPVVNTLNVKWNSAYRGNARLSIIDVAGRVVKTIDVKKEQADHNYQFGISELKPGAYFLYISMRNGKSMKTKFLKN